MGQILSLFKSESQLKKEPSLKTNSSQDKLENKPTSIKNSSINLNKRLSSSINVTSINKQIFDLKQKKEKYKNMLIPNTSKVIKNINIKIQSLEKSRNIYRQEYNKNYLNKLSLSEQQRMKKIRNGIYVNNTIKKSKNSSKTNNIYDVNFIFQRHGTSCANIIKKNKLKIKSSSLLQKKKDQNNINKYAPDPSLSTIGVQQSLNASDFLKACDRNNNHYITSNQFIFDRFQNQFRKQRINKSIKSPTYSENDILIFASELIRSQQTVFLSFIDYLPDYLLPDYISKKKKIMIIPWLNEKKSIFKTSDNEIISLDSTRKKWSEFISKLYDNSQLSNDLGNTESTYIGDKINSIFKRKVLRDTVIKDFLSDWNNIFELPSEIYNNNENIFGDKQFIPADTKSILFYLKKIVIRIKPKNNLSIILVGHRKSLSKILTFFIPTIINPKYKFNIVTNEIVNCEIIKLPSFKWNPYQNSNIVTDLTKNIYDFSNDFSKIRLFPIKFNLDYGACYPYTKLLYYYTFYVSSTNLFITFPFIISQKYGNCMSDKLINPKSPYFFTLKLIIYLNFTADLFQTYINFTDFYYSINIKTNNNDKRLLNLDNKTTNDYFFNYLKIYKLLKNLNNIYQRIKINEKGLATDSNKISKETLNLIYNISLGQIFQCTDIYNQNNEFIDIFKNVIYLPNIHKNINLKKLMNYYLFDFCGCNPNDINSICNKIDVIDNYKCK